MSDIRKTLRLIVIYISVLLLISFPLLGNLNSGLVAYFPLDANASDLVSGATGTIYGATTVQNRWGMANSAFSFDGTDDYIEVPYQSSYSSNLFSFSLWVNPSAYSSSYQSPFTFRGLPTGFMLYKDSSNTWSPWVGTGSTWGTSTNLGAITLSEWVFIVCTYNGTAFAGYKNGSLVSTSSPSFAPNTSSPLRIGAGVTESTTPDYFFNGKVDELRFYNRALSDTEIKQLQVIDNPHFKDVTDLGYTYVDENLSNGGPWALLGYSANGNFPSNLTVASGQIDEGRQGSAVLNALSFAQSAPKLAITWTNSGNPKPSGGISSYDHGVAFEFTDPSLLTLTAAQTPSAGSGSANWSTASTDPSTVLLNLEVIQGSPNLPSSMYARRETFGAMYGNAYGFAKSSSNAQLDWTVDGQAFNVLYLGLNGNNGYVAPGSGGNANGYEPSTMAIWGQLEMAPYNLQTSGNLSIIENSSVGTVVDQFTATDNNDDNLSFSLLPVLPSQFSPVLWLDANDSSTFSPVNGKISQWQDKSVNNHHYSQSDSARYPSYSSNSLNGLPSITFDGNDFLTINSRLGFAANPDISIFAVTSFISNIATDNRIFQLGNNSHSLAVAGGTGSWSWRFNGGNEIYNSVILNSVGQQAWVRQHGSNYAASQFFLNGTEQARVIGASDTTVPSDNATVSFIGAGASAGSIQSELFSNVKISELIVLNDSSEISRKAIETYLARKWGLNYPHTTSNGIFELESNGTLKSLVSLDRETSASYPIVVRASDTNGNFFDQNFSVSVLDDGLEDTDSDGFLDSVEYDAGSDPESNFSIPGLDYGLLLWYPLDGNTSDMSGNARHATLSNVNGSTAGFVDGKIFKALDFDGVDDFLSVPHDSGLDLRRTMSLSLWLKLDTIPTSGYSTILYKGGGNAGSSRTYSLWLENGSRYIHATSADSTDQQTANSANSAFTNNSWMHLVMLLDRYNGTIRAFKDKALVANGSIRTTDTVSSSNPLLFGSSQETNSNYSYIDGQMDEIRLYERVLYSFEIENLYDAVVTDTDSDGLNDAEENLLDTNRTSSDTDGDGLTDFEEVMGYHTYEQINSSLTWSGAKVDAENRGGYLATITSLEEKNKVETIRSSNSWLGASDTQTEGTWQWVTGEPWGYTFWNSSEPNGGTGENYLITFTPSGYWNDYHTGTNGSYILEKEYFSNPNESDTDGDGFPDFNETQAGTDPSSATSSLLHNDLIAHWKFDETSGTTASDSSGNNYHATLFNAGSGLSAWASGKVDGAIQLDGVDDYLAIQNLFYNQVGQIPQVTVSVWVKTTKSSEGIVMSFDRSEYWRLSVGGSNNNGRIMFGTATSSVADLYGQTIVSDGAWHMITASYSNGTGAVNFYVDGVADGSATAHSGAALGSGTTRFGIFGANNEDASYNTMESGSRDSMLFQGLIDDARIYNRALSANEVYVLNQLGTSAGTSTNATPTNLSIGNSQINENQTVGSIVGLLSAADPDGDNVSYQLTNGAGDSGNSFFSLDMNGTLKTAVVFDYENNASTYSIRARASDTHGASVEGNFTITLLDLDDTAPIITLNGSANITHEAGNPYIDVNASWSDAVDGLGVIVASGEVNASEPGTYVLSFNYTDAAGNAAQTVTRTVLVVDTTAPIISLNGDGNITHEAGTPYIDANASWSDAVDGLGVIVAIGEVNASEPGTYVLSYTFTDAAGNVAQPVTRTINVLDTTAPIISLHGDANITHEAGNPYIDANASWSDAVDGLGLIFAIGEVNASVPGTYVLSFNYTDGAGNVAQPVTRTINVLDTTAPTISLHGDANIAHEAGNPYIDANASWSDAVDGLGVIVASGEVNTSVPGLYVLTYNYTDDAGNMAEEVTREVEVINLSPTALDVMGDGSLSIYENEPNGTIVGVFQGMDPNPGYALTYSFVGIEEIYQTLEDNSTEDNASQLNTPEYLHLDPQGTLTTLRPLDYEVDPVEVPILVRVTDQYGGYYEKIFTVSVLNVVEDFDGDGTEDHYDSDDDGDGYEDSIEHAHGFDPLDSWNYPKAPIIRTLIVEEQNETLVFGAQILSSGGIENIEVGILIFDEAGVLIDESIRSWEMIDGEKLFYSLEGFTEGQNILYQAYAQNLAGTTTGQFLEYRVGKETGLGKWWSADLGMDGGWRESTWLGIYLPNSKNDWIYHLQLGWLYVQGDARGGLWLWMPEEKWLWTRESVWPFLWSDESAGWLYPIYSNGNRYFYDYISQGIR